MAKAKYGVLLVTGGHTHQETYAADFAADRRCRIVAVTDEVGVAKKRALLNLGLADALSVPYIPDLAVALRRKDVDIASVCAPPERRGRVAVACALAGKHLYLDKSLVPSVEEADALVAAVQKAGVRCHMFSLITQPWARRGKEALEQGTIGKLRAIRADVFFAKGHAGSATLGRARREEFPPARHQVVEAKRELDNIGVYPIGMIRWLTGKSFRTVHGITGNYFFKEHQRQNVEDFGLLSCTLDGGLSATIAAGRIGWRSHPAVGMNRLTLVGTKGTLVMDAGSPRLEVHCDEEPWLPPKAHPDDPMGFWDSTQVAAHLQPKRAWVPLSSPASDAAYFLDCLDAGIDSEMNVAAAAHVTEVLVAGYLSASRRETVELPLKRAAAGMRHAPRNPSWRAESRERPG